jgi:hypothetical protein
MLPQGVTCKLILKEVLYIDTFAASLNTCQLNAHTTVRAR